MGDRNLKMLIQYDGSRYSGWQRQGNTAGTIQGKLENALSAILDEDISVSGSGRTDAGVHAVGQVANFHTGCRMDCAALLLALNERLPEDIGVCALEEAPPRFHARLSAREKTYQYTINLSQCPDVFRRKYEYRIPGRLDIAAMEQGARLMLGTHDFRGFSSGHTKKSTVRTIREIEILPEGEKLYLRFTGDGFLYNMVRILTGTLLEIGQGSRRPESVLEVFETRNRTLAGATAPPQGLCLIEVCYEEGNT